jgi:hypothetical protein
MGRVVVPLVLAISLMAPLPTPTQIQPAPTPMVSASAAPTASPILGGVTLGEDSQRVLARLGLHKRGWGSGSQTGIGIRIFPAGCGDLAMTIAFDDTIRGIFVEGTDDPKSQCADPFGDRVGDSIEHLEQLRGGPDALEEGGDLRYGPSKGAHWTYTIKNGKNVLIALSDGF